ncbi:hypothetical protein [Paenibacillus silviterrae]|uniref:hypothetical protein n=1 Tax=Paenibacillus silviterrae TaxID=3242194 RepID=UPI0025433E12|nr:hypothetical protein [Paenibacillus chinjuensis]
MRNIRHVNLADQQGRVYCCLRNRVVDLDDAQKERFCSSCIMYAGDAQGLGVECEWEDARAVEDPHTVTDPQEEWRSNQVKQIPNDSLGASFIIDWD